MAKQKEASARVTLKTLQAALTRQYPRPDAELPDMDESALLGLLARLQVIDLEPTPILDCIATTKPGARPNPEDYATIAFMDDCLSTFLRKTRLPAPAQPPLYNALVGLIRAALIEGLPAVSRDHGILDVMDQLVTISLGWNAQLGKAGKEILEHIKTTVNSLSMVSESQISDPKIRQSRDAFLKKLCDDTEAFMAQELKRTRRLEDRLIASETGLLKTSRARNIAAQMINDQMQGKALPREIINFLQGPWFDSLQLILVREGMQSDTWFRATKLTETLIWTFGFEGLDILAQVDANSGESEPEPQKPTRANFMSMIEDTEEKFDGHQRTAVKVTTNSEGMIDFPSMSSGGLSQQANPPQVKNFIQDSDATGNGPVPEPDQAQLSKDERQKLYRIIQDLPKEIKPLLLSLEYQEEAKSAELATIVSTRDRMVSGASIGKSTCTPLPCEPDLLGKEAAVAQALLDQVKNIQVGQWFVFDAKSDQVTHIKLLLKLDDLQQLLFTNRSGIKVLQTSFDEFAYFVSSGTAIPIHPGNPFSTHIRNRLHKLVNGFMAYQESLAAARSKAEKKASAAQQEAQSVEDSKTEAEAKRREEELSSTQLYLEAVQEKADTHENKTAMQQALERVDAMFVGAWLRIPVHNQQPTDCKLGVKLVAADKYIFVDRRGSKVGEYKRKQLAAMLVSGDCEILDSGVEFRDTLEKIVTGLRQRTPLQDEDE